MRVLLIWPRNGRAVLSDELSCCEPLPLEYLAGALRPNHDVIIHDLRLDPPLCSLANDEPPGLVGLALPFTSSIAVARKVLSEVKQIWPQVPVVLGGHHPTVCADWLEGFAADYVIIGEGGEALKHLVECLERGVRVTPFPGLSTYKSFSRESVDARPSLKSLDSLASPDRSLLRHRHHRYFHSIYNPIALVRFSAGCPYKCSFCILWRLTDQQYLTKEIPRIISELNDIDSTNVYVVDDEAFIQPARMSKLAAAIIDEGIQKKYHMYVRADTALRHCEVIERWAEAGLDSVLIGAESMDDADLRDYQKGTVVSQTVDAMKLFHALNIKVRANFIVRPDYVEDDFARLAQTVQELRIDLPSFAVLTPLPGTKLYEATRDNHISDNPELFDCYHTLFPTRMPLNRFYEAFARLLCETSGRNQENESNPGGGVFYFSNQNAFDRMTDAIRNGTQLHEVSWEQTEVSAA